MLLTGNGLVSPPFVKPRINPVYQHVREPTHHRGNQRANILDLVLSNEDNIIDEVKLSPPVGKSHHSVITFQIRCYYEAEQKPKTSYKYDKGDYVKLNKHIDDLDWIGKMNSVEKR